MINVHAACDRGRRRVPLHHRDPLDRMPVAQAQLEKVPILSTDRKLTAYDVEVIW